LFAAAAAACDRFSFWNYHILLLLFCDDENVDDNDADDEYCDYCLFVIKIVIATASVRECFRC